MHAFTLLPPHFNYLEWPMMCLDPFPILNRLISVAQQSIHPINTFDFIYSPQSTPHNSLSFSQSPPPSPIPRIIHSFISSFRDMFKSIFSSSSYRVKPLPLAATFSPSVDQLRNGKFTSPPPQSDEQKTEWRSIYLSALFSFTASVQFTLFFTSLWPFMQIMDRTVTVTFFGAIIAMYSLSQIIASPILGIWSNHIEKLKPPMILCNIFMFIGNAMYFFVELFPAQWSSYILLISRFVAGIGWAQIGLLKSFASSASINEDRSRATAFVTGGTALGSTMGPAFQTLFTWLDYPGTSVCIWPSVCVNISMFNAPALFACILNILLLILLIFWFRESFVGILQKDASKLEDDDSQKLPPYDRLAIVICYLMRFTQFFIFTNLETIGTAFAMMMFMWSPTEVVFWESIAHSLRGAMAVAVYGAYIVFNLGKRVNDRLACLCSLFGLLLFHVFTFSWPFLPENVQEFDEDLNPNITTGCNSRRFAWCDDLRQINVWVYYVLIVICVGASFPNINVTMNTLFSRMIGPRMQSRQQGTMEMFGGMGRMLGPLLMGFLYRSYGPRAIWILESAEIGLMILLWLIFYKRLVPLRIPAKLIENGVKAQQKHPSSKGKEDIYSSTTNDGVSG